MFNWCYAMPPASIFFHKTKLYFLSLVCVYRLGSEPKAPLHGLVCLLLDYLLQACNYSLNHFIIYVTISCAYRSLHFYFGRARPILLDPLMIVVGANFLCNIFLIEVATFSASHHGFLTFFHDISNVHITGLS